MMGTVERASETFKMNGMTGETEQALTTQSLLKLLLSVACFLHFAQ